MLSKVCLSALALAGSVLGAPTELQSRAVVAHDSLNPIAQRVQSGAIGTAIAKFNPRLHIAHGCQPYTAVDDAGNTSGGLKPGGKSAGSCGDTTKAQTYARAGLRNGRFAVMYSWYFPKDQTVDGVTTGAHRHDWENVVLFIDDPSTTAAPRLVGGAASGHGAFKASKAVPGGDSPTVEYFTSFPTNHELQFTSTVGLTHAISDWGAMPDAEKTALQNTDFGSANVPFKDGNFEANIDKAVAAGA